MRASLLCKEIKETYGDKINICTVIGFPLGYNTCEVKVAEAKQAIAEGASEVDMVVNQADVKTATTIRWKRKLPL